jgi:hypothetical protein
MYLMFLVELQITSLKFCCDLVLQILLEASGNVCLDNRLSQKPFEAFLQGWVLDTIWNIYCIFIEHRDRLFNNNKKYYTTNERLVC